MPERPLRRRPGSGPACLGSWSASPARTRTGRQAPVELDVTEHAQRRARRGSGRRAADARPARSNCAQVPEPSSEHHASSASCAAWRRSASAIQRRLLLAARRHEPPPARCGAPPPARSITGASANHSTRSSTVIGERHVDGSSRERQHARVRARLHAQPHDASPVAGSPTARRRQADLVAAQCGRRGRVGGVRAVAVDDVDQRLRRAR